MNDLYYLVIIYIFFFLQSCTKDHNLLDLPEIPSVKDTIQTNTSPEQIAFLFRVEACFSEPEGSFDGASNELNEISFGEWSKEDSILTASFLLDNQIQSLKLIQDSLSKDLKTAWFSSIISFIPSEETKWLFYKPAKSQNFRIQDGKLSSLYKYANLSGTAFGTKPIVTIKHDLKFFQVILPASVKTIECSGDFSTIIDLESVSVLNDTCFFAIPQSCNKPFIISAKDVSNIVYRSSYVYVDSINGAFSNITSISLLDKPRLKAEIKSPYKSYLRGNFSGITRIAGDNYAVVSDASDSEGWYSFEIPINDKGEIIHVSQKSFIMSSELHRDLEDIAYNPSTNKMLLVAEDTNTITEHAVTGPRTGLSLETSMFDGVSDNFGLESLAFNVITKRYWTTTEGGLKKDGGCASAYRKLTRKNKLRLQSYLEDGSVGDFWFYETDSLKKKTLGFAYAFGVSALCALNDGRLLVLERETLINSEIEEVGFSCVKVYLVDPSETPSGSVLEKTLLVEIINNLSLSLTPTSFSGDCINYEGMCLGPILPDGSQMILLVSDSQDNMCLSQDDVNFSFSDTFLPIVLQSCTDIKQ